MSCIWGPALQGFQIRSYDPTDHDRFTGTIGAPMKNPNQLFANLDLTGVGWRQGVGDIECALVSRQHVVFATHFAGELQNKTIVFLNTSNQLVTKSAPTKVTIMDGADATDLTILTLSSPIDADAGVEPLPYLDLQNFNQYKNKTIGIVGQGPLQNQIQVIGRDIIDAIEPAPITVNSGTIGNLTTKYSRFSYVVDSGTADEGYYEVGDSGSPSFVETNGRAALVGVHSFYGSDGPPVTTYELYDCFIPYYIPQLDAQMAPLGYRMRPVNASATTLSGAASVVETTPRRLHPLTLEFDLTNTGANLTGNLEVEFVFPAGQEPDTVAAAGWVTYGSGTKWTLRKATLASSATATLTATWAEAPAVASLTPTLVWRSDTVTDQSVSPVIALAPSYAEWSAGLSLVGEQEDPDDDTLVNLLEYAFGGDPESGALTDSNGEPLLPSVSSDGSNVTLRFPEREDAAARGLSYTVWYSTGLDTWTDVPPAGAVSNTAVFIPDIDGFVERIVTWPDTELKRFVRVAVTLDE
ncbi:MAG: trypsin-like serine protease [Akkermansiaceae bacterium]|nr:trypsin-like serine protease [Akkermansiaceae bacterium]MCP5548628.1 trypsin-like serine protease [Akkermansiaceae bacterium]